MIFLKHFMSCGMGQRQSHPSFLYDPVAQPVEHRPFKAGVLGSNPSRVTIFSEKEVLYLTLYAR